MNIYFAPLEGITSYILRNAQNKYFGGIDKYFAPFITPSKKLGTKIKRDLEPENNTDINLVPQILTDNSKGFLDMCNILNDLYGYEEFNLNLGCPSGTVVAKGRGSGFLARLEELDRFLDDIFKSNYKISVKTRIGKNNSEEFYKLLEIFEKYPIYELIIHPRTRDDMYNGNPRYEFFKYAQEKSNHKLCYNGDIFCKSDFDRVNSLFNCDKFMLGRGIIINPNLPNILKGENKKDIEIYNKYYNEIFENYSEILYGTTPVLFKIKELMVYMGHNFKDSEKILKKIKKSKNIKDINFWVNKLFSQCEMK
ncbi:MAG: tRNA-dihydrouridine synthase family protein [Lachnospirales bacterium]